MTPVHTYTRSERAREAIDSVISEALKTPAPVHWSVTARDDHSGEPAIYVYVEMPNEQDIPKISARNQLVADMLSALERIEDDRFPYLHFGPREDDREGDETADEPYDV